MGGHGRLQRRCAPPPPPPREVEMRVPDGRRGGPGAVRMLRCFGRGPRVTGLIAGNLALALGKWKMTRKGLGNGSENDPCPERDSCSSPFDPSRQAEPSHRGSENDSESD